MAVDLGPVVAEHFRNVGFIEGSGNENPWGREQGIPNNPYCDSGASMVPYHNGYRWWPESQFGEKGCAYCPSHIAVGSAHGEVRYDHASRGDPADVLTGDLLFYDWNNDGVADHVETAVEDVGGAPKTHNVGYNTGSPEGCHETWRDRTYLLCRLRPTHYRDGGGQAPPPPATSVPQFRDGDPGVRFDGINGQELIDQVRGAYARWPFLAHDNHGLIPFLLEATGSRETNLVNEVGDGGHGHGVFQLDDRSHGIPAGFDGDVQWQANVAAQMLVDGFHAYGGWRESCDAYNGGAGAAHDENRTTHHNYGSDVLARRQYLESCVVGSAPPAPAPPPPPPAPRAPDGNPYTPLDVDGGFGSDTIHALQWTLNNTGANPRLGIDGDFGPASKRALQARLNAVAGPVGIDGDIGQQTVRALQRWTGAGVDGGWGGDTTRHLQAKINAGAF